MHRVSSFGFSFKIPEGLPLFRDVITFIYKMAYLFVNCTTSCLSLWERCPAGAERVRKPSQSAAADSSPRGRAKMQKYIPFCKTRHANDVMRIGSLVYSGIRRPDTRQVSSPFQRILVASTRIVPWGPLSRRSPVWFFRSSIFARRHSRQGASRFSSAR